MALIRLANTDDAGACLEIYRPIVENTVTSFETAVPEISAFGEHLTSILDTYPWLVSVEQEGVTGYAYACGHRGRSAYQWSVEVSAYIAEHRHGAGLGKSLYTALFGCLRYQGFANAYAGITEPNERSVAFHESMGFEYVGLYRRVGYKLGSWRDVGWWAFRLIENSNPDAPLPLRYCRSEISALLEKGATEEAD